jgi:N-acetylglutamate synthase-like GNAT family acetyltransferase
VKHAPAGDRIRADTAEIRTAGERETAAGAHLLEAAGLPVLGWHDPAVERLVLVEEGSVRGTVAIERRGDEWLVRSLSVAPALRGRGFGRALLAFAVDRVSRAGAARLFALTTTIAPWLERVGFVETTRDAVPLPLQASDELRGACPASARVFVLDLTAVDSARGVVR